MIPHPIGRRTFLASSAAGAAAFLLPGRAGAAQDAPVWHDVKTWGVEGKGWADTTRDYDRFPARAEKSVPEPV